MKPQTTAAMLAAVLMVVALSGCLDGDAAFHPGEGFEPTGRTIRLAATVVDLAGQEVYPGFKANLWAYCFRALDPNDAASAAAVEPRTPLPGDIVPAGFAPGQCGVPGPTLRVRQGDRVVVTFSHSHFHPHTIHWHGQFVPVQADGVPGMTQDTVMPGDSFTYDFVAKRAGTLWYHCHVDTQLHVMQGLYGVMVVEPQDQGREPADIDDEAILVLSTLRRDLVEAIPGASVHNHPTGCNSGFPDCENPPVDITPDVFLINGHSLPFTLADDASVLRIQEGGRLRLRLLNAGSSFEEVHLHGHDLLVTHKDGNPVPAQTFVDTLPIGPGERFDVVVEGNNPGLWALHTHVTDHEANCGKAPGGMHTMLAYDGHDDQMAGLQGELAATCEPGSAPTLPSDLADAVVLDVGTVAPGQGILQGWAFDVELRCAVRRLDVRARLDAPSALATLNTIDVVLVAPDGTQTAAWTLGEQRNATYVLEGRGLGDLQQGTYRLQVNPRQAVEATVELAATVDYYASFQEARLAHAQTGAALCPPTA